MNQFNNLAIWISNQVSSGTPVLLLFFILIMILIDTNVSGFIGAIVAIINLVIIYGKIIK